ncbi:MAG TPA: YbdK family carboxylate-amine ligase [Nostocaceae cyanobacterium]|nr:YbdK family carboxylate-amine ligase [Nostocaceae cyanobacterium]
MSDLDFKSSPTTSLGMEIELQLLNPDTLQLVDGILPLLSQNLENNCIQPEFNQATVEIASHVCLDIEELKADIISILRNLKAQCDNLGMTLCAAGTHPVCDRFATVTPIPRYIQQQENAGYLADLMMTFALHLHVGMSSGDEAIDIMNRLKPYLPIFLALSASSPFWWGNDTGFASYRQRFLASMRNYGIPPTFQNWQDFNNFWQMAKQAKIFNIIRDIHWDLRPQPELGTLEIRVMDAQPTVQNSIMLAAFIHTLILYLQLHRDGKETGYILNPQHWFIEKENYYRASVDGIDANYIEDNQGNTRPIKQIILDILNALSVTGDKLGETKYLQLIPQHLELGLSYINQRQIWQQTGSFQAVTASLVEALEAELK